jgi:hypothetical protein
MKIDLLKVRWKIRIEVMLMLTLTQERLVFRVGQSEGGEWYNKEESRPIGHEIKGP